jgi:hypothetical protein
MVSTPSAIGTLSVLQGRTKSPAMVVAVIVVPITSPTRGRLKVLGCPGFGVDDRV